MASQVKTKKRVVDHGEVFTADHEVKSMCDLVANECLRVDSRFLEPACGNGNFLAEILRRKLETVKKRWGKSSFEYEKQAVFVACSLYGIDILADNVRECRERLFNVWDEYYRRVCKKPREDVQKSVKFVFSLNIVCGNALSMCCVDETAKDIGCVIVFPQWTTVLNSMIRREDFRFDVLLRENKNSENYENIKRDVDKMDVPEGVGISSDELFIESGSGTEILPKSVKVFSPIRFDKLFQQGEK